MVCIGCHVPIWYNAVAGKPARSLDVVEDKAELASLLEAEKSRRRLLEQRFSTAQEEAEKLRCVFDVRDSSAVLRSTHHNHCAETHTMHMHVQLRICMHTCNTLTLPKTTKVW